MLIKPAPRIDTTSWQHQDIDGDILTFDDLLDITAASPKAAKEALEEVLDSQNCRGYFVVNHKMYDDLCNAVSAYLKLHRKRVKMLSALA